MTLYFNMDGCMGQYISPTALLSAMTLYFNMDGCRRQCISPTALLSAMTLYFNMDGCRRQYISPTALLSAMTLCSSTWMDVGDSIYHPGPSASHDSLYFNMDGCSGGHYNQLAVKYYTTGDVCLYQQWSVADSGHEDQVYKEL